jgi:hypothetical protein
LGLSNSHSDKRAIFKFPTYRTKSVVNISVNSANIILKDNSWLEKKIFSPMENNFWGVVRG